MSKVFINPGHCPDAKPNGGMVDSGAVNENLGVTEAEIVRDIGYMLADILEADHEVYLLQSDNLAGEDGYDYEDSVVCQSNSWGADYFLSIHLNAFNKSAHGTEVYYGSKSGMHLASYIEDELCNKLGTLMRGCKPGHIYSVIKNTEAVALIIEVAFVDEDDDCMNVLAHKWEIADAIATGLEKYLESLGD